MSEREREKERERKRERERERERESVCVNSYVFQCLKGQYNLIAVYLVCTFYLN